MIGRKFHAPDEFFACIGKDRTCGKNSEPGRVTCLEHREEKMVTMPKRVLVRAHFSPNSKFGALILEELTAAGVRTVKRTSARQQELEARRMMATAVKVFGENDLGPNVCVEDAVTEMEKIGYVLKSDLHILDCDEIYKETNPEKVGSRVVVLNYEYKTDETGVLPEAGRELLIKPFLSCRLWVNVIDADGTQVHAVEMTAFQIKVVPKIRLKFVNSVWGAEMTLSFFKEKSE